MNSELNKPYTLAEIHLALNQMGPLKSPGLNGFNVGFFQSYWHIVSHDVSETILKFLKDGKGINYIYIVLIPKIKEPLTANDYRPINLCNVVYKLISKVLVNRLKKILPFIISENQSAFILNRLITDNVIIAYEPSILWERNRRAKLGAWL